LSKFERAKNLFYSKSRRATQILTRTSRSARKNLRKMSKRMSYCVIRTIIILQSAIKIYIKANLFRSKRTLSNFNSLTSYKQTVVVTFHLLNVRHIIVNRGWRHDVRHVGADVHFDDLPDRRRWWRMIRRREPVSTVQGVHVLLASVTLGHEGGRGLRLHVEIRRAVEVSVEIGTAAQAAEEAYSRLRLQT